MKLEIEAATAFAPSRMRVRVGADGSARAKLPTRVLIRPFSAHRAVMPGFWASAPHAHPNTRT